MTVTLIQCMPLILRSRANVEHKKKEFLLHQGGLEQIPLQKL